MEREILFRGRRLDNGEWVEGHLLSFKAGQINPDRSFILPFASSVSVSIGAYTFGGFVEADPDTVGQYTGMSDKNGKKIFEGDYVRTKYGRICEVVWHQPSACWDMNAVAKINFKAPLFMECWKAENNEVLGNRWDNPEFLKMEG